jgi:hypothetical protein
VEDHEFLHYVANRLQVAKVAVEISLERCAIHAERDEKLDKMLRTALQSLNEMSASIRDRRNRTVIAPVHDLNSSADT